MAPLFEILPVGIQVAYSEQWATQPSAYAEEEAFIARAVDQRQREFRTGRALARSALSAMGIDQCAMPPGQGRAPQWPAGVVGSISHCRGLCAAAVAPASNYRAIGLDLEVNTPLAPDLVSMVYSASERLERGTAGSLHPLDLMTFSAKESVFKCLYPLVGDYFDFQDVTLTVDLSDQRFTATLNRQVAGKAGVQQVSGRVRQHGNFLLTVCLIANG